ncbi:hypothetical protein MVEN_00627700 [Mycena venus]|uniref:Transmembrane protein n=1 Tax=Mycena venus TaxID=2733690 RepID=A0A8H6YRT7_9AGAR|nr:hypothetical protein MVEN_00627700 [Mycena venus]
MNVIVDDDDIAVQYSANWRLQGLPPSYEGTEHSALAAGESATLVFRGTSIMVFGTVAGGGQARMDFSIDGKPSGSFDTQTLTGGGRNQRFFTSAALEDALHTLTLVDNDSNLEFRTLFLDYFVYTTTSTAGKLVLIDDTDTVLTYSPGWKAITNTTGSLESTQHVAPLTASWVALSFEGIRISLIGNGSVTSVVIDGSEQLTISQIPADTNNLFQSSVLSQAKHTMNISVPDENLLAIDYFLITTASSSDDPPASSSAMSLSRVAPTTQASSSLSLSPSSPTTQTSSQTPLKRTPIGAIAGGAVGGALLIFALLAIFMRRRKIGPHRTSRWMMGPLDMAVRPFVRTANISEGPPPYTSKSLPAVHP